ncbi:MAG: riboflavin synthase [Actinomycetota bacterium]|nr:riboflavin synthase [Actinomycetota bacterium]
MFTGIVRELGRVEGVERAEGGVRLCVRAPGTAARAAVGDSIALSGVCLTATAVDDSTVTFDAIPETVRRSSLGRLEAGAEVNVEPALRAGEPLGGHIVQGHVDGVGRVRGIEPEGDGKRLFVELPRGLERYCVEKGSIALEGVSLTVAAVGPRHVEIALVPHTLTATTLGRLRSGDRLNVEVDIVAKHVERLLHARENRA